MLDSLHRDITLITKTGDHDRRVIGDTQSGIVFKNMVTEYMHMCLEIRIIPDVDFNDNRMAFEAYRAGYSWAKAKEILQRD